MNATLARDVRHESTVHHEHHVLAVRRVGLLDRTALHLGVALIKWGRRPASSKLERRANRLERALAQHRRDLHVQSERDRALLDHAMLTRLR